MESHDYRISYVNIDLRHQYGISVAESQTFLLAKRPSAAMSEEKRLSFAGYIINGFVQNCQVFCSSHKVRFEEILGFSIKCFVINRKSGLEWVEKNEG